MSTEQLDDEEIGCLLRDAAETFRPSADTKAAVRQRLFTQVGQASVPAESASRLHASKWFPRGLFVPVSIAAALVIAVGIGLLVLSSSNLGTAKALEKVVRGSDEHQGWVAVTVTESSGETNTSYRNTAKKITAMVWRQGDQFRATFASRASGKRFTYDSQLQELYVSDLRPEDFTGSARREQIFTLGTFIERMRFETGGVKLEIRQQQESESLCFDLSVPPEKVSRRAVHQMTIWADPRTRLVQRIRMRKGTETADFTVSYADPGIESIYDLGVPRDAKIAEGRGEEDLETLLEALDRREAERFGDAVVLVTETTEFPGGRKALGGVLWVMLTEGEVFYFGRYTVGDRKGITPEYMSVPATIDGWPRPSWQAAREVLRVRAPNWYLVSDGNEVTQGRFDIKGVHVDDGPVSQRTLRYKRTHAFLAEDLWPCRENMWLTENYATRRRVELLRHPHHYIVGVQVRLSVVGHGLKDHVWWFDRERSYIPVERTSEIDHVLPGSTRQTQTHELLFVGFRRLESGTWYPTLWERPNRDLEGRLLSTVVYEMQVFSETDIDPDWFSPPQKRLESLLEANRPR